MGSVKVDLFKDNLKYYETSFSSEEDIYSFLWLLDMIYYDRKNGSEMAAVLYQDFLGLINKKDQVLLEYIKIQVGLGDLTPDDYNKEILQVIAERTGLTKEDCEAQLLKGISNIKENNYDKWLKFINSAFKNKWLPINKQPCPTSSSINSIVKVPQKNSKVNVDEVIPDDLQALMDIQKANKAKLEALDNKVNKTRGDKKQLSLRIKLRKSLAEDIDILKNHYGIQTMNKSTDEIEFLPLVDDDAFYYDDDEKVQFVEKPDIINEAVIDQYQVELIKKKAYEILTSKQIVIFSLYYTSGLTQLEIAEIIGDTQGNVSRDLEQITKKLKKKL